MVQKPAETSRRQQTDLARQYLDIAGVLIVALNEEGRVTLLNQKGNQVLGYTEAELLGKDWFDTCVPAGLRPAMRKVYHQLMQGKLENTEYYINPVLTRSGEERLIAWHNTILTGEAGVITGTLSSGDDITKQKHAEDQLRESEERYRVVIETSPDAIILCNLNGQIVFSNRKALDLFGTTHPEDLLGKGLSDFVPPEARQTMLGYLAQTLSHGGAHIDATNSYECDLVQKDGTLKSGEINTAIIKDAQGKAQAIIGIIRDLTDRKRVEKSLEDESNLLRVLMDHVPDSIYFKDTNSRFIKINRSQANLLGLEDPAQALGKRDFDFFSEAHASQAYEDEQAILQSGQPMVGKEEEETFEDERVRWVSTTKMPLLNQDNKIIGTFGISRDITAAKRREHEQVTIIAVSTALRDVQTRAEILPVLLDSLINLFQAESATFVKYDPAADEIEAELSHGPEGAKVTSRRVTAQSGVSVRVIDTGQPYWTNDITKDSPQIFQSLASDALAGACIPLIAQNQAIGAIWVLRQKPFNDLDLPILITIADIAANAIYRATLFEQVQKQLERITALGQIDRAISSGFDLRTNLGVLLEQVITQLEVDAADILLVSSRSNNLEFISGRGFRLSVIKNVHIHLGEGLAGRAVLENRLIHVADLNASEYKQHIAKSAVLFNEEFVTYYGIPLVIKGRVRGVLEIFHRSQLRPAPEWLDFLETLARQAAIAIDNAELFNNLQQSNLELSLAYDTTLEGWANALELREHETEGHPQQMVELTLQLARVMRITDEDLVHVRHGALLHDAGMMGVPIAIIKKPGPLSAEDWEQVRQHPQNAFRMLAPNTPLRKALDIPYGHHEKWDGSGYPRGLAGEQIPLAARVFAVVDVWDALRSNRPYRPAWPPEKALAYIREQAGRHFDPGVVESFLHLIANR